MAGILFSIQSFYQSYQELRDMEDNYARLREVARMVTVSVVESIASGVIIKAGTTIKEVATEVSMLVKDTKVWQSACDWLKRNVTNIADVAGGAFKGTVDAILAKVRGGKNLVIYKYISQKADDIYAELKEILDADALNYLQGEFYNKNVNTHISDFRLLVDMADCIKAAREALGKNLNREEVEYAVGEWNRYLPKNADVKNWLKEKVVDYIKYGKIYVKKELASRCKSMRASMPNSRLRNRGNMALAEVNISGVKNEFVAHSQIHSASSKGADLFDFSFKKPEHELKFRSYVSVGEQQCYIRTIDAEAKILEDIAARISDPNIRGNIDLYTEKPCCISCRGIIQEFREMFPGIKIYVYNS